MKRLIMMFVAILAGCMVMSAQNSLPAPGSGSATPPTGGGWSGGWSPVAPPPNWGSPWGFGWNGFYGWNPNTSVVISPTYPNSGKVNVVGVGYDDEGVWRTVPMSVQYNYSNSKYNVIVLTAWNPWTDKWDTKLNIPAVNTSYRLDGKKYRFYAVLSTGTYYFNL